MSLFLYIVTKEINHTAFNLISLLLGLCPSNAWLSSKSTDDRTNCPQPPKKTNPQLSRRTVYHLKPQATGLLSHYSQFWQALFSKREERRKGEFVRRGEWREREERGGAAEEERRRYSEL